MSRVLWTGLLVISYWVLTGNSAPAQQSPRVPPEQSLTQSAPTPIPLSEVAAKAESVLESLRDIKQSLSADQTITTAQKSLTRLERELNSRASENEKFLAAGVPLEFLRRLEIVAKTFSDELDHWNHDLSEYSRTLDRYIAQLSRLKTVWELTLQSPEISQSASVILNRGHNLVDDIHRTLEDVQSRRAAVLALEGRVLQSATLVQEASNSIEEAQNRAVKNLFIPGGPPIWSRDLRKGTEAGHVLFFWRASFSVSLAYIEDHPTIFLFHGILILLLAIVIYRLRRKAAGWSTGDASLPRAMPVLDLPVSTAAIFSIVVTSTIYSSAPALIHAILGAVLLIPTALILRRLIDRTLFPIVNVLLAFYLVDQLRYLTGAAPTLFRLFSTVEMLGGTIFLIWLVRSNHLRAVSTKVTKRFAQILRAAAWFGLIVFPIALIGNIFGYVNLANLLGDGTLRSAYVAAGLYAALRILEGLIILALRIPPLVLIRVVSLHRPMFQQRVYGFFELLAFLSWLSLSLSFFGFRDLLITNAEGVLSANLTVGSLSLSVGQLVVFIITIWASFLSSSFLRFLLEEDIYYHWKLERGIPQAISTIIHYAILLLGFFVAMAALGVDLTKITILAGAFTVGIGFGLQTVINNFVCGLILLFERPIKVGDVVQVDTEYGEVRRIGIRACIIRKADGSEVIVPNGILISNKVINWTYSDRYRAIEVPVSVARGVAPQRVVELLKTVAANHPSIAKEPAPEAYVANFAPGTVSLQLRAWTDQYEDWIQVRSDLSVAIDDALAKEKIAVA